MSLKGFDSTEWVEAALGVATSRLHVIEVGREIGSVAEVCRREGISKQTYYRWKRRYEAAGLRGLQDRPIPPSPGRPRRTTGSLALMILDHVKKHPREGCVALSKRLAAVEVRVSSPTIQKALIRWGLGSPKSPIGAEAFRAFPSAQLKEWPSCDGRSHHGQYPTGPLGVPHSMALRN